MRPVHTSVDSIGDVDEGRTEDCAECVDGWGVDGVVS